MNLLSKPSFEADGGAALYGTAKRTTANGATSGTYALELRTSYALAPTGYGAAEWTDVDLVEGETYALGWDHKRAQGNRYWSRVLLDPGDGTYVEVARLDDGNTTLGVWASADEVLFTAAGTVGRVMVQGEPPAPAALDVSRWAFDSFSLERVMASSQVDICNMALSNLRHTKRISAITDDNEEARACDLWYADALREALARADWPFARRSVALVEQAGDPPLPWAYQYVHPGTDCVQPRLIDSAGHAQDLDQVIPFMMRTVSGVRLILTDQPDAELVYTHYETAVGLYPAPFVYYLSWVLASKIAGSITKSEVTQEKAEARAEREFSRAWRTVFASEFAPPRVDASYITDR